MTDRSTAPLAGGASDTRQSYDCTLLTTMPLVAFTSRVWVPAARPLNDGVALHQRQQSLP